MATYEYRCPTCESHYELRRPMSESSSAVATCPDGHPGGVRLLSVFASVSSGSASGPAPAPSGGMPCGPACACH